jgi:putative addiction module component (TIGR02574 family)
MNVDIAKLLDDAMKLPAEGRAALAGSLIQSLEETVDEDAEAAWAAEIRRRLAEIEAGRAKLVPWPEAQRKIFEE